MVRYHISEGEVYNIPGPKQDPPPVSAEEIRREMLLMVGALQSLEFDISHKRLSAPCHPYRAAADHLRRAPLWLNEHLQTAFRKSHQSTGLPRLMGNPVTSFHEAAFDLCGKRVQWLNECISVDRDQSRPWHERLTDHGNQLAAEADYIYRTWRFPPIDFGELKVGLELEYTWATANSVGRMTEPLTIQQIARYFNVHRNKVSELVLAKYPHETIGSKYRLPIDVMPPLYHAR